MPESFFSSLPIALVLALSPAPIIAIIIILMTPRAKGNVLTYVIGWFMGIMAIALLTFAIPGLGHGNREGSMFLNYAQLAMAILFLGTAVWKWIYRPKKGDPIHTPKLFRHLDEFGPWQSLFMGFALSGLNIKNISLIVAGALMIQSSASTLPEAVVVLLIFAVTATSVLISVIAIYFLKRAHIDPIFARWKRWLIKHNNMILVIILILFGSVLLKNGLEGLLSGEV